MRSVVTVREALIGTSVAYLPVEAPNSSLTEACNHAPLRLPKLQDLKSLTLIWRSFSWWGRGRVASAFAYKGGQFLSYDYLQPMPALITQDGWPEIIDALLRLISRMGQGAFLYVFWAPRRPVHPKKQQRTILNILRLTVGYLNGTIDRPVRSVNPEIGPDGSSQTRRKAWVYGYGARFGPPRSSGSDFWTILEPNRTVFLVQTQSAGR